MDSPINANAEVGPPSAPRKENTNEHVTVETPRVFFMIGCQRSGSNWLRTMMSEREDLIAPHPPHIMRDFVPRLEKYGDLAKHENLKVDCLLYHVKCKVSNHHSYTMTIFPRYTGSD